jgi:hypothetical protein
MPLVLTIAVQSGEEKSAKYVQPVTELDVGGLQYQLVFVTYWVMQQSHFVGQGRRQGKWFKYDDLHHGRVEWTQDGQFDFTWNENDRFAYTYVCKNYVDMHDKFDTEVFPILEKHQPMLWFMMRTRTKRELNRLAFPRELAQDWPRDDVLILDDAGVTTGKRERSENATPSRRRTAKRQHRGPGVHSSKAKRFNNTPGKRDRGRCVSRELETMSTTGSGEDVDNALFDIDDALGILDECEN